MIEATYIVNDYVSNELERVLGVEDFVLYPGRFYPETEEPITFGTYKTSQNVDYSQPYIKDDFIMYEIYHVSFDKLQQVLGWIVGALNPENFACLRTLYDRGAVEGIKFLDIRSSVASTDNNPFVEGTEYFSGTINIMLKYVETKDVKVCRTLGLPIYLTGQP